MMTSEETDYIALAKQADVWTEKDFMFADVLNSKIEAFAKLVASEAIAKEREACAKIADRISDKYSIGYYGSEVDAIDEVAEAIRLQTKEEFEPCPFMECGCDGNHPKGKEEIRARGTNE